MSWSTVYLLFLIALVFETAREVYAPDERFKRWADRHYSRIQIETELPWWAERKSGREKREHQRKWHIDLLSRMKPRRRV